MARAASLFPLIRRASSLASPYLIRSPVSANQITSVSLIAGLTACWAMTQVGQGWLLVGASLLVACYVLDNCDGEVARAKDQCSEFGEKFDTFVDWVVHAGFFAALGVGVARETGDYLWFWLGLSGAVGGTINYFVGWYIDARFRRKLGTGYHSSVAEDGASLPVPEGWKQWVVFVYRELFRADFCFVVLALALFDATWLLLPTAAVGAHAYWMTQFVRGVRDFHV